MTLMLLYSKRIDKIQSRQLPEYSPGVNFTFYTHRKQKNAHFTGSLWGKNIFAPPKKAYISGIFKDRKWLLWSHLRCYKKSAGDKKKMPMLPAWASKTARNCSVRGRFLNKKPIFRKMKRHYPLGSCAILTQALFKLIEPGSS